LNRLAHIKPEPVAVAAKERLQGRREQSAGEFGTLLDDRPAGALKVSMGVEPVKADPCMKPVALPTAVGQRSAAVETFEIVAVTFRKQEGSGFGFEDKQLDPVAAAPLTEGVFEAQQIRIAELEQPLPSFEVTASIGSEQQGTIKALKLLSGQVLHQVAAVQNIQAGHPPKGAVTKYKVSDHLLNNFFGFCESVNHADGVDVGDKAIEVKKHEIDEIIPLPAPSTQEIIETGRVQPAPPPELVSLQIAALQPGPLGTLANRIEVEFSPAATKASPAGFGQSALAAPQVRSADSAAVSEIAQDAGRVGFKFEAVGTQETNPLAVRPNLPGYLLPEVSKMGAGSSEPPARTSLLGEAEETVSVLPQSQAGEVLMPIRVEANAITQPISNSGTIIAGIRQVAAEIAEPEALLSEAEEISADIHGRLKSVRIKLQPESLGDVVINLHSQQEKLRIEVRVRTDEAGRALLPEIDSIASALSGLGLPVDQVTLSAPGGGITVVHSPGERSGGNVSENQSGAPQERPAGENASRQPERRKNELDEKSISQSRGIYI
jgi:hypothetical protein